MYRKAEDLFHKLNTQDLNFTVKNISVKHFASRYAKLLPLVVYVGDGHCSFNEADFNFSGGEMYRISHSLHQKRVVLKDEIDQLLSFPIDHPLRFHIVENHEKGSIPQTLEEIIASEYFKRGLSPHITAEEIIKGEMSYISFYAGADEKTTIPASSLGMLEIVDVYDEKYLVGNSILEENVAEVPVIIPVWLKITLHIVSGICGDTTDTFDKLLKYLNNMCSDELNVITSGNKEIMVFQGNISDYDGNYDDINLGLYTEIIKDKRQISRPHTYLSVKPQRRIPPKIHPKRDVYEEVTRAPLPPLPTDTDTPKFKVVNSKESRTMILDLAYPSKPLPVSKKYSRTDVDTSQGRSLDIPPVIPPSSVKTDHIVREPVVHPQLHLSVSNKHIDTKPTLSKDSYIKEESMYIDKEAIYKMHSDVLKPVHLMSVNELGEVLKLLKLDKHISDFKDKDVDGDLLCSINQEALMEEFNFSTFNAMRLLKFAHGWRARQN